MRVARPLLYLWASPGSLVGLLLVISFMLVYYRLSGVNAVVALLFNLFIINLVVSGLHSYAGL